jgi:hypothetical protein
VETVKCSVVTDVTKADVYEKVNACAGNAHVYNDVGLVMNKHKERFVIDGDRYTRRNIDTKGDVKGPWKTVLIPQAPNNLINLLTLCRDINSQYEGDAYCMRLLDIEDKLYLYSKT